MAMQLLRPMMFGRKPCDGTTVGCHLPYGRLVDEQTIETRDGMLLQTIHIRGFLFETADTDELNYRKRLRDLMLQTIGSSSFAVYSHLIRRPSSIQLTSKYPDKFSQRLDEAWRARLAAQRLYSNDLYLTIIRRPLQGTVGVLDKFRSFLNSSGNQPGQCEIDHELRALDSARDTLMSALRAYSPKLLTIYETPQGFCSEQLELLSMLYNCQEQPILLPHEDVGNYLPYRRISFGQHTAELGSAGKSPRTYIGVLSIKDYPGRTLPGMFDELMRLPVQMTITQSFGFVDRQTALGRMNLTLRRMRATDDEALSLRDELTTAKNNVAAGLASFGEHHMTVAVRGDSQTDLDKGIGEVHAMLADMGCISVREESGLEPAFWAQFPGNFRYIARRGLISTGNFAGLVSGHNFAVGKSVGNHWGDAVTILETTAAGPYYFNFHLGDLGNFTVIGPSGSGKTVVLNFLLAQARKFSPRIIFFDKDRGAELFIRAIGGRYDLLRPGKASGINPLQLDDNAANRKFLIEWLSHLVGDVDAEELNQLSDAVDANFNQPHEHRRLRHIAELLRGAHRSHPTDLWSRLRPWWGDGDHAWLFDNENDLIDLRADAIGFDMTQILDSPSLRTPAMMYLFHRVEERLDGTKSIIVVDEGWKALDDEVFVRRIKDWEKTIRKRNGIVGFATQSAQDALESSIASAIIEQAGTQIFMANPKAREVDYISGFGLTNHEYEIVRTLPDDAHCFLIKHGNDSVVARLNLEGENDLLHILSGRERTVRLLDGIRNDWGDDPDNWLPRLLEVA